MNRLAWIYLSLLFVPALALAFFAFRVAEQDYEEGREARRRALESTAELLSSRVEGALADASRRADETIEQIRRALESDEPLATESAIGFARDGDWLGYEVPRNDESTEGVPTDRDLRWFRLSSSGGEHYELVDKDPELALDAYAFYLPRIQDRTLRDRLRFKTARAALSAGCSRLGRSLLEQLMGERAPRASEEGLPLDVLAALRLLDAVNSGSSEEAQVRMAARDHFRRRRHALPTDLLKYVATRTGMEDPVLTRSIESREVLEDGLRIHPGLLVDHEAVLEGDRLFLARQPGEGLPAGLRAILQLPVALPPLSAGPDLIARLDRAARAAEEHGSGARRNGMDVARSPVRLSAEDVPLAHVEVRDARMNEVLDTLRSRRNLQQTLIGLLVVMTLAGGGALLYYLGRERKLARLRTQLLANVSHELKTPATSIRMLSEMLATDDLGEAKSRRFADLLHGESLRLGRIIENVLEFSRLERGRRSFTREDVDLSRIVRRVFESFSYRTRGKDIILRQEGAQPGAGASPIEVSSNENAIECILFNLLDNAVKYSTVKIEEAGFRPEILLKVDVDPGRPVVRISVTDNGIGIAPRDREKIFEEFYRARFEDYGVQGTGLGLSISRALARRLGGGLDVESELGRGSTFVLTLPLPSGGAGAARGDASVEPRPEPPAGNERSNAARGAWSDRSSERRAP